MLAGALFADAAEIRVKASVGAAVLPEMHVGADGNGTDVDLPLLAASTSGARAAALRLAGLSSTNGEAVQIAAQTAQTAPAVVSIEAASVNPATPNVLVSWRVNFNTEVSGVDAADFVLAPGGGVSGAALVSVSGSGRQWLVTAYTGPIGSGTLRLDLVDDDSIVDTANGQPLGDPGAGNANYSGAAYTIGAPPLLNKTVSTRSARVGDVVTFTLTAANPYAGVLADLEISDPLPSGLVYGTSVSSLGGVSVNGQTVNWSVPQLPAGGAAQLSLALIPSAAGAYTNTVTAPGAMPASASLVVLPQPAVHFRMDEPVGAWSGAAAEVQDSGGGRHASRVATAAATMTNTVAPYPSIATQHPAVSGEFCNAARFDGRAAVRIPGHAAFNYTTELSASAWIYPTAYPARDLRSILSNDVNYELHLDSRGRLYWWWGDASLTSAARIPLNRWTHVAIAFNSAEGRQTFYINGVPDSHSNHWRGSLRSNSCPFSIGGDVATDGACTPMGQRNFRGMIDEVKLYPFEMSADQVRADMTVGRICSGTFDHLRIEHDGVASPCGPEVVIVKACLDAECSTLYAGDVTVQLPPGDWLGGEAFVLSGGIAARQLNVGSASAYFFGAASATPSPNNATRCFVGNLPSCLMLVAASSCRFDAVETGEAPGTALYTKLVDVPFSVDVLALSDATTVNAGFVGNVDVDLVEATQAACPGGAGLTPVRQLRYASAHAGRQTASFVAHRASRAVRVRTRVGHAAPACSADRFTLRPQGFAAVYASADADPSGASPSAGVAPQSRVRAGEPFALYADSGTPGYDGLPRADASRIAWPDAPAGGRVAPGTGTLDGAVSGNLGFSSPAAGDTGNAASGVFTYDEVGYFRFEPYGVYDDSFTVHSGDPANGDCTNDFSNAPVDGKYGCKFGNTEASGHVGRFIPDHFETAVTPACVAGDFSYSGQPFGLVVTARNAAGGTTQNYAGAYAKDTRLTARDAADTVDNPGPGALSPSTIGASAFSGGVARVTPAYAFADARTVPTRLRLRASEAELSSASGGEGAVAVRSGRAWLANAHGSELLDLPLPMTLQYWSGASGWQANTVDRCTTIRSTDFAFGPYDGAARCATAIALAGSAPEFRATLLRPGAGNAGWTDITLNLGATPGGTQCVAIGAPGPAATSVNAPWLQYDWRGTVDNPTARATFGVDGAGGLLHRREAY